MGIEKVVGMALSAGIMHSVDSSNVEAIGWNPDLHLLTVDFKNGSSYQYMGVPEEVYQAFMSAPSKGKFVWETLRGGTRTGMPYMFVKVR
jgi:hypothetical protein